MSEFKSLEIFQCPRTGVQITEDNLYWKNLGFPCAFKEYGAVDFVDFCQQESHKIAVTCSAKVQIYSAVNSKLLSTLTRFRKTAYGGRFRPDGRLLVAGSEDGFLRLFEVQAINRLLRIFKGHKAAVHRCDFTSGDVHLVSFSDDKTVALWDIPTETKLSQFGEHTDYIRAGAVSKSSQSLFLSGSYDHTVKLYDARTGESVLSVNHGAPVESVAMFPSGGIFISAGGTSLKVWDPVAGRMLTEISQHHKTITALCFASNERRLMSASLDRHVKIYDSTTYEVVHTLNYPSPILSVAVSPEDQAVGVGMTDGLFSLRLRKPEKSAEKEKPKKSSFRYRFRGTDYKTVDPFHVDTVVPEQTRKIYRQYETHLRKFESSLALDSVLKDFVQKRRPEVTVSVLMELMRRGSLRAAMAGREGDTLLPLLKFVTKYIGEPRFMRVLVDVGLMLIELYGPKLTDPETREMFRYLQKAVDNQVDKMKKMMEVQGVIQTILAASFARDEEAVMLSNGVVMETAT